MNRWGQARIIDALLALIVIMLGLSIVFRVYEFVKPQGPSALEDTAYAALASLDSEGYLAKAVYSEDPRILEAVLNSVIPAGYGYNCTVYGEGWSRLLSVEARGYDPYRASSVVYVLFGCNGTLSVRYVVLSVSGG